MTPRTTLTLIPNALPGFKRVVLEPSVDAQVGRSSRCQVRLPEDARLVSRVHAVVGFRDGEWFVTDMSRRGTFLGGTRLTRGRATPVQSGDVLRFGDCEFCVSAEQADTDSLGPEGSYTLSVRAVDLAAVDTAKVLQSALELPERLGNATSEPEIYDAACEYLVGALAPAITTAYVTVACEDGSVELLGRADRADTDGSRREVQQPLMSRRVVERLKDTPGSVLFVQRQCADATLSATVTGATLALGASLLETDRLGRPTILYAVGDHGLASGEQLVAQYLRLIGTLVRQHLLTLRRAHLAKYFSPKVLKLLIDKAGSTAVEGEARVTCATSLFFDVRGSSLPLDASAEDLATVYQDLRRIIGIVTDSIFEHEGTVIDYAGDGVFAAWGVPLPQAEQAELAVQCATVIAARLRNARFRGLGPSRSLFGIGIAMGEVLAGALGSAAVFKYGILGPSVSAACRLSALTKPDRLDRPILITSAVHAALPHSELDTRRVGLVELAGLGRDIEVFEVLAPDAMVDSDDDD